MTARQREVFLTYAATNPLDVEVVAKKLFISPEAVRVHLHHIGIPLTEKIPGSNKRRLSTIGQKLVCSLQ